MFDHFIRNTRWAGCFTIRGGSDSIMPLLRSCWGHEIRVYIVVYMIDWYEFRSPFGRNRYWRVRTTRYSLEMFVSFPFYYIWIKFKFIIHYNTIDVNESTFSFNDRINHLC